MNSCGIDGLILICVERYTGAVPKVVYASAHHCPFISVMYSKRHFRTSNFRLLKNLGMSEKMKVKTYIQ